MQINIEPKLKEKYQSIKDKYKVDYILIEGTGKISEYRLINIIVERRKTLFGSIIEVYHKVVFDSHGKYITIFQYPMSEKRRLFLGNSSILVLNVFRKPLSFLSPLKERLNASQNKYLIDFSQLVIQDPNIRPDTFFFSEKEILI